MGYIIELTFGEWTAAKPLTCSRIDHYSSSFSSDNINVIVGFLATVIDRLSDSLRDADSITPLIAQPAPLFHFPWSRQGSLSSDPNIDYNHMIVVKWATISTWAKSSALDSGTTLFSEPEPNSKVVVKVSSRNLSGGCVITRARKIVTKFHNYSYEIVMSLVIVNSYKNAHNSYQIVK